MRRSLIMIALGLAVGIGAGLAAGWYLPFNTLKTDPSALSPAWQSDWVLMTAQAYSIDSDLDAAKQRLALLGKADLGALVAQRGEKAIAGGLPPSYVGALARLAAALGTRTPALTPYLTR